MINNWSLRITAVIITFVAGIFVYPDLQAAIELKRE